MRSLPDAQLTWPAECRANSMQQQVLRCTEWFDKARGSKNLPCPIEGQTQLTAHGNSGICAADGTRGRNIAIGCIQVAPHCNSACPGISGVQSSSACCIHKYLSWHREARIGTCDLSNWINVSICRGSVRVNSNARR